MLHIVRERGREGEGEGVEGRGEEGGGEEVGKIDQGFDGST